MFHSVKLRILAPIVLLMFLCFGSTGWITWQGLRAYDDLQTAELIAYDTVEAVERAQDTQLAIDDFVNTVLSFDHVFPAPEISARFDQLLSDLRLEMQEIQRIGTWSGLESAVIACQQQTELWLQEVRIALGLIQDQPVPSKQRLERLAENAQRSLDVVFKGAQSHAQLRTETKREEYINHVATLFFSMMVVSVVFGLFSLSYGTQFASNLRELAGWMERIRAGDYTKRPFSAHRTSEIGAIERGIEAFGVALKKLADANHQIRYLAMHDQLTDLPNRRMLEERLRDILSKKEREDYAVALLHIDLDRFKQVNDMFGHAAGDAILRHASKAMADNTRGIDLVSRIGGDEFVILMPDIDLADTAVECAMRVINAVSEGIEVAGELINVGASVGIAIVEEAESDVERVLANADMALYVAKGAGRGQYALYSDETRLKFETDMTLLRELRTGLDRGEIIAYFQPQIDVESDKLKGAEALVRWRHPTRGVLSPGQFIDLAFDNGLGDRISDIMLREAIGALLEWRSQGIPMPCVSVNLSAKQLRDGGLVAYLEDTLFQAGLMPQDITIEVLESVLFGDEVDPALATIAELKKSGFRIELDDFGTGHASISNLRKFSVDGVKIDRFFIQGVDTDPAQEMILLALIDLCANLDINCLAEGVETYREISKLLSLGCAQFQGYAISRPMPREEMSEWYADYFNQLTNIRSIRTAIISGVVE